MSPEEPSLDNTTLEGQDLTPAADGHLSNLLMNTGSNVAETAF